MQQERQRREEKITQGLRDIFDLRFFPYLSAHHLDFPRVRLLDVGGGRTGYALLYADHARDTVVLDLHDETAAYEGTGIDFRQGDITGCQLAAESFDFIASHSVFEHVENVGAAISEVDRLLTVGGRAFITIRPLYYSAYGYHHREFEPWQHLLKQGEYSEPPRNWKGAHLNHLTLSEFLGEVGRVGWRVHDFTPDYQPDIAPPAELAARHSGVDLRCREFFGLFEKVRRF